MIGETGFQSTILRHIDGKDTSALMGGTDAETIRTVGDANGALDIDLLPLLIMHLEGHPTTFAGDEMSSLGVEIHQQVFFEFFLDARLWPADNVFLRIIACGVRTFVDRHYPTIYRTELAEEVACHLLVVEVFAILTTVGVFGHAEIQHPTGVGPQFVIARIE